MQVLGGYGYCGEYRVEQVHKDPPAACVWMPELISCRSCLSNPIQQLWRDAKLIEIGGGTIEAHQKNIARDLSRLDNGLDEIC